MNSQKPDAHGRFGRFGGRFVPETLMAPVEDLEQAYREVAADPVFQVELAGYLRDYVGRPTPLYRASRLSRTLEATIFLKREDLCHTGAHKINNALGQALLAKRMGKKRVIAETGAGQHGVATATACALLELDCEIYMGTEDTKRQALNVYRMEMLGARVIPVDSGSRTLKDAINEAMRDWVTNVDTYYLLGSVLGPHPYPMMVRDFQAVIGREARRQVLEQAGCLPDLLVACVGGGSNSIGLFSEFLPDSEVAMVGVEAGGRGTTRLGDHAARFEGGVPGVLHGTYTYVLQDALGQIAETHSVSAGLDYPSIGPEHADLMEEGRVRYGSVRDESALRAFHELARLEGILPALESAHAVAWLFEKAAEIRGKTIIVNLSGRGDKDVDTVRSAGSEA